MASAKFEGGKCKGSVKVKAFLGMMRKCRD